MRNDRRRGDSCQNRQERTSCRCRAEEEEMAMCYYPHPISISRRCEEAELAGILQEQNRLLSDLICAVNSLTGAVIACSGRQETCRG